MRSALLSFTVVALLGGCASTSTAEVAGEPIPDGAYTGPMSLEQDYSDNATPLERSGAAGLALECDGAAYNGGGGDYVDGGLESVQDSAQQAVENWLDNEAWFYEVPETGYRVERDDGDRVLLSYDVDQSTLVAFIAADGIRDYNDDEGWGVESWAACDPAELPASVTDALGIGVWEDAAGRRLPVTRVQSYQGPEHCDWQEITFLLLGPGEDQDEYVRDPNGELTRWLQTTYDPTAELPANATDTGLHREGRQLWLGSDGRAAYLVSNSDPDDVERWPAARQPITCA